MCISPFCLPRNSARPWQRTEDLWNNLLLNPPPPNTPSSAENYEQWAVLTFLRTAKWGGACAKPCRAGPMARGAVLSRWSRAGQWRATARLTWRLSVRSLSSQSSIPASAGVIEDLTPARSDLRYLRHNPPGVIFYQTLSTSSLADRPSGESDTASSEEQTFLFFLFIIVINVP